MADVRCQVLRCAIVSAMKNFTCRILSVHSAVALGLLFACGMANAQLKVPSDSKPGGTLGGGLHSPATRETAAPSPAPGTTPVSPGAAPAEEERSADAVIQDIANCVLEGLPQDWKFARVKVIELSHDGREREFEAKYTYVGPDGAEKPFKPCDLRLPGFYLYKLNGALEPDKRNWKRATLVLSSEGKFDLNYEYDKPETPAAATKPKPGKKDVKKK